MGKNNKHKKNLKSERSKVKLKGRTLPKGTNVTNTTFKVRKIIIGDQLKYVGENKIGIETQIKDNLSKLRHYNQKICMSSLVNLKYIIGKFSTSIIDNQFSAILKNLAHLATNEDRDVRRESFTVLQALIGPIVAENHTILIPYYDILSSYLCCAMTHIDSRIQNDSLLLLDILLKSVPTVIINNYSKIMDNFLDMISKLRTESKPERSLTLNLNSRISTVKWRVNVLEKLQLMLKILMDFVRNNVHINCNDQFEISGKSSHLFNENKPIYLGLYDNQNLKINELGLFSGSCSNTLQSLSYGSIIQNKIITLMPLLFETWLEAKLNNTKDSSGCFVLNAESSALLKSIMEVIVALEYFVNTSASDEKNEMDWFYKKYRKDFTSNIIDGFPYSSNQFLNKKNINRNNDCLIQNIHICYMFVQFYKNYNLKEKYHYSSILDYIKCSLIKICEQFDAEDYIYEIINNTLVLIFFKMTPKNYRNDTSLKSLLECLIKLFYGKINLKLRKIIFQILCEISQNETLLHLQENSKFLSWIQSLPFILCSANLTLNEMTFFTILARHKNAAYLQSVLKEFPRILEALAKSNDRIFVCNIINILYYLPGLMEDDIKQIDEAIANSDIPDVDKDYAKSILRTFCKY